MTESYAYDHTWMKIAEPGWPVSRQPSIRAPAAI